LAIPKPIRERLNDDRRLYLTPGLDGCLAAYPEPAFAAVAERLAAGSPAAREVRDYSRLFYSHAACVVADAQWRIRLPPELAKWAGLDGEVMVVGVHDHLEVWTHAKWQEYVSRRDAHYDQLAEQALEAGWRQSAMAVHSASAPGVAPVAQPRPR
jgi:MraZ protein